MMRLEVSAQQPRVAEAGSTQRYRRRLLAESVLSDSAMSWAPETARTPTLIGQVLRVLIVYVDRSGSERVKAIVKTGAEERRSSTARKGSLVAFMPRKRAKPAFAQELLDVGLHSSVLRLDGALGLQQKAPGIAK